MSKLKYLSTSVLAKLKKDVASNLDRYREGGFEDLVAKGNWSIESSIDVDFSPLSNLDPSGTPAAEIENSLLVWKVLHNLRPALASEERIWARLTHVECIEYTRIRWIGSKDDDAAKKSIGLHFFAKGTQGMRDDNAISRLWWSAKIAKMLNPSDQRGALEEFLKKADFRLNSIERPRMFRRPAVGAAVLRALKHDPWFGDDEQHFRSFMKVLNTKGAGILFEIMPDVKVDVFMNKCIAEAKAAG